MNRRPVVRRLMRMLQSSNPNVRKQAVAMLSTLRNPRATTALRYVAQTDPNPELRAMAQSALTQRLQARGMQPAADPRNAVWDCVFCGTRDIQGSACPNCAAPRPTEADEQAASEADNSDPAATPFMQDFGGGFNNMPPRMGWRARRQIARTNSFIFMMVLLCVFALTFWLLYAATWGHRFFLR